MEGKTVMTFLFAKDLTVDGQVDDLQEDKVTILVKGKGENIRFVTHPHTIVLMEKEKVAN